MPSEHSKESPFFMMIGRDPILPLNSLLAPKLQYLGNDLNLLSLEALKNMFEIAVSNLKKARTWRDPNTPQLPVSLKEGDTVLIKNHTAGPFDRKYVRDFRVVKIHGHQVELRPSEGGKTKREHISNVKYIMPTDRYINQLPAYKTFGHKSKLRLNPDKIPDLGWEWADQHNTQSIGQTIDINTIYVGTLVETMAVFSNYYTIKGAVDAPKMCTGFEYLLKKL